MSPAEVPTAESSAVYFARERAAKEEREARARLRGECACCAGEVKEDDETFPWCARCDEAGCFRGETRCGVDHEGGLLCECYPCRMMDLAYREEQDERRIDAAKGG